LLAALATANPITETSSKARLIIIISLSDKFQLTPYSILTVWMKQKFNQIQESSYEGSSKPGRMMQTGQKTKPRLDHLSRRGSRRGG
jgi:hypothetical protein